jgi:ribosomal protein L12E/L44/L45/RPP1/RPP2
LEPLRWGRCLCVWLLSALVHILSEALPAVCGPISSKEAEESRSEEAKAEDGEDEEDEEEEDKDEGVGAAFPASAISR